MRLQDAGKQSSDGPANILDDRRHPQYSLMREFQPVRATFIASKKGRESAAGAVISISKRRNNVIEISP